MMLNMELTEVINLNVAFIEFFSCIESFNNLFANDFIFLTPDH